MLLSNDNSADDLSTAVSDEGDLVLDVLELGYFSLLEKNHTVIILDILKHIRITEDIALKIALNAKRLNCFADRLLIAGASDEDLVIVPGKVAIVCTDELECVLGRKLGIIFRLDLESFIELASLAGWLKNTDLPDSNKSVEELSLCGDLLSEKILQNVADSRDENPACKAYCAELNSRLNAA